MQFTTNAETMRIINGVLSGLVEEAVLKFDEKGLTVSGIDPAHVAMAAIELGKDAFEDYDLSHEQSCAAWEDDICKLGMDVDKFKDALKIIRSGSKITFKHDEDNNKLVMTSDNLTRRIGGIDTLGINDPKVPELRYSCMFKINREKLLRAVYAGMDVSDRISFAMHPDHLFVEAVVDADSVEAVYTKDELGEFKAPKDAPNPPTAVFGIEYIMHAIYSAPADAELTAMFADRNPIRLESGFADGKGKIVYLVAPRPE